MIFVFFHCNTVTMSAVASKDQRRSLVCQVVALINEQVDPQPIQRSVAVPEGKGRLSKHDFATAPIPASLLQIVDESTSFPDILAGGLPAIKPKSTAKDIAKANAAAASALDFVVNGLKQRAGLKPRDAVLSCNVDYSSVEGRPSQAYFVLHQGVRYNITPETISITEMYDSWLQNAGFVQ
jgi:hypothetical protein